MRKASDASRDVGEQLAGTAEGTAVSHGGSADRPAGAPRLPSATAGGSSRPSTDCLLSPSVFLQIWEQTNIFSGFQRNILRLRCFQGEDADVRGSSILQSLSFIQIRAGVFLSFSSFLKRRP